MNSTIKEYVTELLTNYPKMQAEIALLRYEQAHPVQISPDEMIDAMAFARGDGEGRAAGHISNKTLYIAMSYQNAVTQQNRDDMDDITSRLLPLQRRAHRLEYYLSLLGEAQRETIRLCYFDGLTLQIAADCMEKSVWSVRRLRDEAVDSLCEMYAFIVGRSTTTHQE